MAKRIDIFTGKFSTGQRVRDTITGYTGTIVEVDPDSFNPPPAKPGHRRGVRHNPYRVRFDNYVLPGTPWKPEQELEAI